MRSLFSPFLLVGAVLSVGCTTDLDPTITAPAARFSEGTAAQTYIIVGKNAKLPADLAQQVAMAGGTLTQEHRGAGIAFATSSSPEFSQSMSGNLALESVVADRVIAWTDPVEVASEDVDASVDGVNGEVASSGDDDSFYSFQWAPAAIQAPEAWNAGYTGRGVRVAILDGAIYSSHQDLVQNLDVAASRSFVPGTNYNQDVGTFWHGTHVAGIVAAADNRIGTVGIAPNATLVGVKVLHNGTGAFSWIINGIIYAATPRSEGGAGADVINMSLGAQLKLDPTDQAWSKAVKDLQRAVSFATEYAYKRGVTVIVSAGNAGNNFDLNKAIYKIPAESDFVLSVSSTGPMGWGRGAQNFDLPAYYTDFGKSLVEVAAPGGNAGLLVLNGDAGSCTIRGTFATLTRGCFVFDQVMSTVRGTSTASYNWAQGTSMAAPTVSGVVALMLERHGKLTPSQVKARLRQTSLDRGEPGNDMYYGHGWVNAFNAVK